MIYKQQQPIPELQHIIKSFWLIDSESDATIRTEKIIPDGYPELIFHYKDPYRINISGTWKTQGLYLLAGQIKNHFYLENIGQTGMFGIKFQPWAVKLLFDFEMNTITDTVISIPLKLQQVLEPIIKNTINNSSFETKVKVVEQWVIQSYKEKLLSNSKGQLATQLIINSKGELPLASVLKTIDISERSLERYFKTYIGLSPKFYSRIIRFSNVFNLIQDPNFKWTDISYLAGFYDQSHFIKNFKEFTGEEPSSYGFNETNMANFFLKK